MVMQRYENIVKPGKYYCIKDKKSHHHGGSFYGFPIGTISKVKKIVFRFALQSSCFFTVPPNFFLCCTTCFSFFIAVYANYSTKKPISSEKI